MKNFIFTILKSVITIFLGFIIIVFIFSTQNSISFSESISYFRIMVQSIVSPNLNIDYNDVIVNGTNINNLINTIDNYYYNQLDDTSKVIYAALENNIDNLKKENFSINFSTSFNNILQKSTGQYKLNRAFQSALDAFSYDHPELFYLDITKISFNTKCISFSIAKAYVVEIAPRKEFTNYLIDSFNTEEKANIAIKLIEDQKDIIVNSLSKNSDYDKVKYIHNFLINSIEYGTGNNVHNIYGALVEKKSVCEGYAKAYKYLLNSLNVDCLLIIGTATNSTNSEAHMWNYVNLNNEWYGVDLTWDDPIIIGDVPSTNNTRQKYLLKGSNVFDITHVPSGKISKTGMLFTLPTLSNRNYK